MRNITHDEEAAATAAATVAVEEATGSIANAAGVNEARAPSVLGRGGDRLRSPSTRPGRRLHPRRRPLLRRFSTTVANFLLAGASVRSLAESLVGLDVCRRPLTPPSTVEAGARTLPNASLVPYPSLAVSVADSFAPSMAVLAPPQPPQHVKIDRHGTIPDESVRWTCVALYPGSSLSLSVLTPALLLSSLSEEGLPSRERVRLSPGTDSPEGSGGSA